MKKKILIIATGGTIACANGDHGLTPQYNVEDLLSFVPRPVNYVTSMVR